MPQLLERLQTKVGPLPAWAWAAIPAGAYVVWSYYKAAQAPEPEPEISPLGAGEEDMFEEHLSGLGGYGVAPNGSSNVATTPNVVIDTNLLWQRQAFNYLVAQGVPGSVATRALNAYLFGDPEVINSQELAALEMALSKFGSPPEGGGSIPQITPTPTPTPVGSPTGQESGVTINQSGIPSTSPSYAATFDAAGNGTGDYVGWTRRLEGVMIIVRDPSGMMVSATRPRLR